MGNPVQLPAGYADAKPFQPSAVQLPAGYEDAKSHQLTPQGASPSFWNRVFKSRKYSEESGFEAKDKTKPEGLPGVSEGAGLAGGLASWDEASGGEILGGMGNILQGDVAKGLHRIFTGTGHAMTPLLPILGPGMIAAPVTTGATIAGGAATGALAKTGAEALGATPEQSQVASDVGNIVGGIGANRAVSAISSGVSKARALWDLIPEETQKSIAKKAISLVPGAKTASTALDIKKDISNVLDAIRSAGEKAAPASAAPVAASQPAAAASGEMTPQGWYYLGRLQEIAKGIEEQEATAAAPKNITPARAANLTKPVVPPASTEDLSPLLQEMLKRVTAGKGQLSDLSIPAGQSALSTPASQIMSAIEQEGGNVVGVARLAKAAGVSVPEARSIIADLQKTGRIDIHVGRQAGEAQESIYGAQLKRKPQ